MPRSAPVRSVSTARCGTAACPAGLTYGELALALQPEGVALANLASLPHISVAGAVAIFQFGDRVLLRTTVPKGHFTAPAPSSGPNYADNANWIAKPGLAVTAILTWVFAWNEYLFAMMLSGQSVRTVTVALQWRSSTRPS